MPLEIIGAGFGRTGTLSLHHALEILGFPCYHMVEVLDSKKNPGHLDFWHRVAKRPAGSQHHWETVFAKYRAAVDNPACCVWRELMEAYPNAKIILTVHPKGGHAWYESTLDTIYFTENKWQFKLLRLFTPFGRKFGDMASKLIWQRSHAGTMKDREAAVDHYYRHIEELRDNVPPDRLLVFSVDQGWPPLCDFLDVAEPAQTFPNVNDRAEIKKTVRDMSRGAYAILAGLGLLTLAAIYGLSRAMA